ncbi:MAG TPA: Uma2 family endonuclease [Kofleriaceae bacterium]|jgi:Uma2 family endonuclease
MSRDIQTYADLKALPPNVVGELIDGTLYTSPRPAERHAMASSVLGAELMPPLQLRRGGPGGWVFYDEPELHFGDDALVPDLAGWRDERAPTPGVTAFEEPPDWVCEVLSPSTAKLDRMVRLRVYAREGVRFVWLVDPIAQTVELLELDGELYRVVQLANGDARIRGQPFEEVELDLVSMWTGKSRAT